MYGLVNYKQQQQLSGGGSVMVAGERKAVSIGSGERKRIVVVFHVRVCVL